MTYEQQNKNYLFGISANSEAALYEVVKRLHQWIQEKKDEFTLADLSYTLLVRKMHYSYRVAFVAEEKEILCQQLEEFHKSSQRVLSVKQKFNQVTQNEINNILPNLDATMSRSKQELILLSQGYEQGIIVDWKKFVANENVTCLPLPLYPYEKERYWIYDRGKKNVIEKHTFVEKNTNELEYQVDEQIIKEHVIQGNSILPAMAQVNDMRKLIQSKFGKRVIKLQEIAFITPFVYEQGSQMIASVIENDGEVTCEISSLVNGTRKLHSKGKAILNYNSSNVLLFHDEMWKTECSSRIDKETCYKMFQEAGVLYGTMFQGIEDLWKGTKKSYAKINLRDTRPEVLSIGMMDSALQAIVGVSDKDNSGISIPFSICEIEYYHEIEQEGYSYVQKLDGDEYEVTITNLAGQVCTVMKGVYVRKMENKVKDQEQYVYYEDTYAETTFELEESSTSYLIPIGEEQSFGTFIKQTVGYDQVIQLKQLPDIIHHLLKQNEKNFMQSDRLDFVIDMNQIRKLYESEVQLFNNMISILSYLNSAVKDKKLQFIMLANQEDDDAVLLVQAFLSFAKTYAMENSKFYFKGIVADIQSQELCRQSLQREQNIEAMNTQMIYYTQNVRKCVCLNRCRLEKKQRIPLGKDGGIYVIAGANGKIGTYLATYLISNYRCHVIGIGRHDVEAKKQTELLNHCIEGATFHFIKADLSNREQTAHAIHQIHNQYGNINGIIHCAGVLMDSLLLHKKAEEVTKVVETKYKTAVNLDEETNMDELDYFVIFSSIVAKIGNPGQSDYAFANGLVDTFSKVRNKKCEENLRKGVTVSINWPYWAQGGMTLKEKQIQILKEQLGTSPIMFSDAVPIMEELLSSGISNAMILKGDTEYIESCMDHIITPQVKVKQDTKQSEEVNVSEFHDYIMQIFSKEVGLDAKKLNPYEPYETYGIDSTLIISIVDHLEETFPAIPKTVMFEYKCISELEQYLMEYYKEEIKNKFAKIQPDSKITEVVLETVTANDSVDEDSIKEVAVETQMSKASDEDIAIIGISGRYPQADNLDQFWKNLKERKDCISEVPRERWNHDSYLSKHTNNKSPVYSKWGGFIDGADQFDPMFFHISPREAELMDPQERILLETVWHTMENAAYTRKRLSQYRVGVYVGVMYNQYQLWGAEEQKKGNYVAPSPSTSSIANRISYFFDLKGPSMCIDTMCSSSLTAIHLACESLRRGETDLSIAGGVNLTLHPSKYIMLNANKFASTDGRCRSFGKGGDGYVPGEGVGAVLLKPLSKAIKDMDQILGVIKASALNHGGKTNGYSVPDPIAQQEVIENALQKAGIHSEDLSCIEAHGTGTALGDPIEIAGLCKAFHTEKRQFCRIGSVKSNIGHTESAAGMAALTKMILQMKYHTLVPSLHADEINPEIHFESTPFLLQRECEPWSQQDKITYAGISCFGAGGSNAHVILSDWKNELAKKEVKAPRVMVLSARKNEQLRELVQSLYTILVNEPELDMDRVLYTLQIGREAMEHRVALLVDSRESMVSLLKEYLAGNTETKAIVTGILSHSQMIQMEHNPRVSLEGLSIEEIARLWMTGAVIDWKTLYQGGKMVPVTLAEYPFARERYWIPTTEEFERKMPQTSYLPMVTENLSDFYTQKYISELRPEEYYLKQHEIGENTMLPAAFILEMMMECCQDACKQSITTIQDIRFVRPVLSNRGQRTVQIQLEPKESIDVKMMDENENCIAIGDFSKEVINSQVDVSLKEAKRMCQNGILNRTQCYKKFESCGMNYGEEYQVIDEIHYGENQCFAYLKLNETAINHMSTTITSPLLLDGCLQAIIGALQVSHGDSMSGAIPIKIKEILFYQKPAGKCAVYIQQVAIEQGSHEFDIYVWNEKEDVCVQLLGVQIKTLSSSNTETDEEDQTDREYSAIMATPIMVETNLLLEDNDIIEDIVIVVYEKKQFADEMDQKFADKTVYLIPKEELLEGAQDLLEDLSEHILLIYETNFLEFDKSNCWNMLISLLRKSIIITKSSYIRLLVVGEENCYKNMNAVAGILRCAVLECSRLSAKCVSFEQVSYREMSNYIEMEAKESFRMQQIHYDGHKRFNKTLQYIEQIEDKSENISKQLKKDGVYLITGGMGSIGLIIAKAMAKRGDIRLILCGRRPLDDKKKHDLEEIKKWNTQTVYMELDVSDQLQVIDGIQKIKKEYGEITGIIHTAGVLSDSLICNITDESLQNVLQPKVDGAINLDEATKMEHLDFFLVCSSLVTLTGNYGQAVYAYANGMLTDFVHRRVDQMKIGKAFGNTIAIHWPLWKEGSMHGDPQFVERLYQDTGMVPLESNMAISAMAYAMEMNHTEAVVLQGNIDQICHSLIIK